MQKTALNLILDTRTHWITLVSVLQALLLKPLWLLLAYALVGVLRAAGSWGIKVWSVDESRCRRWRAVSRLLRFVLRYITMPTRDACTRRRRAHNLRINDYKLHNYFELLGRLRALAQHHSIFNILRLCYCNFCSKLNCVNNTTLLRPSILIVKNHRMRRARVYYYKL